MEGAERLRALQSGGEGDAGEGGEGGGGLGGSGEEVGEAGAGLLKRGRGGDCCFCWSHWLISV